MNAEPIGRRALWSIKPLALVCDEAHTLNNTESQIFRTMLTLCARHYLYITATPSNNHLLEFGALFYLLRVPMSLTGTEWTRLSRFQNSRMLAANEAESESVQRMGDDAIVADALKRLQAMLSKYKLSRLGNEVGVYSRFNVHRYVIKHPFVNTRERIINEHILRATHVSTMYLTNDVHAIGSKQIDNNNDDDDDNNGKERTSHTMHIEALITRGKQVATAATCISWAKILSDQALIKELESAPDLGSNSTKVQMVKALISDTRRIPATDKIIITSYFLGMLCILERELTAMGISCVSITGKDANAIDRMDVASRFQNDATVRVCLMSLRVATSITLSAANHIIYCDPWPSPSLEEQAAGRVMRLCQKKNDIFLWYLIVSHSIEEHVHSLAMRKKEESERNMHGTVDTKRLASRAEMRNLGQLRDCIARWNALNDDPTVSSDECNQALLVHDEWAMAHNAEALQLDADASSSYNADALLGAVSTLVDRNKAPPTASVTTADAANNNSSPSRISRAQTELDEDDILAAELEQALEAEDGTL
jgi:SNF2 family DNA or RNA helicase